jgi:hypothetical protein
MPGKFDLRSSIDRQLSTQFLARGITVSDWLLERWIAGEMWRETLLFGATAKFENEARMEDVARTLADSLSRKIEQYACPDQGITGKLDIHGSSPWPECFAVGNKLQLALGDYAARGLTNVLMYKYPAVASYIPEIAVDSVGDVFSRLQTELAGLGSHGRFGAIGARPPAPSTESLKGATVGCVEGIAFYRVKLRMVGAIRAKKLEQLRTKVGSDDNSDTTHDIADRIGLVSSVTLEESDAKRGIEALKQRMWESPPSITRDIALAILEGQTVDEICEDRSITNAIIAEAGNARTANALQVRKSIEIRIGLLRKEFAYRLQYIDLTR